MMAVIERSGSRSRTDGRPGVPGFTLVELLVVIAIIGLLIALVFPAVQAVRGSARRTQCANNIKQLAVAFNTVSTLEGAYPAFAISWDKPDYTARCGGWPGDWYDDHGWYSQIGPFIEQSAWYNSISFDKSFSDPANDTPRRQKFPVYACPDDGIKENEWQSTFWARIRANYVVNAGNTNFGQTAVSGVPFLGAPFGPRSRPGVMTGPRVSEIADGLSTTLMLAEIITINTPTPYWGGPISDISTSLGGNTFNGWLPPNSTVPDDSTRVCPAAVDYNGIPGCTLISGDMKQGKFAARSKHPNGVTVATCDGAVRFMSNSIDLLRVWRPLTTANGSSGGELLERW